MTRVNRRKTMINRRFAELEAQRQPTTPLVLTGTPHAEAPWELYQWGGPDAVARDLWCVKTSQGLVIGPIFGAATARLVRAAPELYDMVRDMAGVASDETPTVPLGVEELIERIRHGEK